MAHWPRRPPAPRARGVPTMARLDLPTRNGTKSFGGRGHSGTIDEFSSRRTAWERSVCGTQAHDARVSSFRLTKESIYVGERPMALWCRGSRSAGVGPRRRRADRRRQGWCADRRFAATRPGPLSMTARTAEPVRLRGVRRAFRATPPGVPRVVNARRTGSAPRRRGNIPVGSTGYRERLDSLQLTGREGGRTTRWPGNPVACAWPNVGNE